ncbi:potassium transporter TrkA [Halomarina salina]|uniref:Potassium transporter TrkA n=1 Tax=Halomarina salina TaxID=1872699 RepID=A0ABD5RQX0_9EURY
MINPTSLVGGVAPLAQAQLQALADDVVQLVLLASLVLACAVVAGAVGGVYRWYARSQVPDGLSILAGISVAAIGLNTKAALGEAMTEAGDIVVDAVLLNVGTFLAATLVAFLAGRAGDRIARAVFDDAPDARDIVRAVGRQISVTLPQSIDDIPNHDRVPPETKTRLEGTSFGFPRRLTVEELRHRLVERLKSDYEVGHVDVDLTPDGTVEYLALGGRAAGIGPTLPPGQAAVAIRADPSSAASAGDLVQVWDPPEHVVTGELRDVAGDVATVALDDADADALDGETSYRLVTLPSQVRVDREFAALFRAAEETLAVLAVAEGSALVGRTVGSLPAAVVAVRAGDGAVTTLPDRSRTVGAGESLFVVARPDVLRKLESTDGVATPSPATTE